MVAWSIGSMRLSSMTRSPDNVFTGWIPLLQLLQACQDKTRLALRTTNDRNPHPQPLLPVDKGKGLVAGLRKSEAFDGKTVVCCTQERRVLFRDLVHDLARVEERG